MNDLDREILKLAEKPEMCREARALILVAGAAQAGKVSLEDAVKMLMEPEMPLEMRLIPLGEELPTEAGEYYFKGYCGSQYAFSEFNTWCPARVFMNDQTQRLNCEVTRDDGQFGTADALFRFSGQWAKLKDHKSELS